MARARKPLPPAMQHAQDASKGRILVGKYVLLAVRRHLRNLRTAKKRGLVEAAQYAIDFQSFTHETRRSTLWRDRRFLRPVRPSQPTGSNASSHRRRHAASLVVAMIRLNLREHPRRAQEQLLIDRMTPEEVLDLIDPDGPRRYITYPIYCYLRLIA